MNELESLLRPIRGPERRAAEEARRRWDALAKPLGSLGELEDSLVRIAGLTGEPEIRLDRRCLLVFCADNGVVAEGVSQCGSEVTAAVARALAAGESTVCPMARAANCRVLPVDMGIRAFPGERGVVSCRIMDGTASIRQGPAMSRAACLGAIRAGFGLALLQEADILLLGEMGIGNTTTAAAVSAVLLGLPPEKVSGRGAGLSDAGLARKRQVIREAIERNRPDPQDPVDVLAKLGGLDLAALCGACLGAAYRRTPVLLDGMITAAAALCAIRLCPQARAAMLASHVSAEPAGLLLLRELGLRPLIDAGLRLGEGSGAVSALPLLDMALAVYRSGHGFDALGIPPYTPQED